jgi:hypothetical protein
MRTLGRYWLIVASCGLLLVVGCGDEDATSEGRQAESTPNATSAGPRIVARGFEASAPRGWVRRDDLLNELELPAYGSPIAVIAPDRPGTVETYIQMYENNEAGGYEAASAVIAGSRGIREKACRRIGKAIGGSGAETGVLPISTRPDDTVITGCTLRTDAGSSQYRYTVLKYPVVYEVVGESQADDPELDLKRPLDQLIKSVRIP